MERPGVISILTILLSLLVVTASEAALKETFMEKMSARRNQVAHITAQPDAVVDTITIGQLIGGDRGLRTLLAEVSEAGTDGVMRCHGLTIDEVLAQLPVPAGATAPTLESFWYFLLTGEIPSEEDVVAVQTEFQVRKQVPEYVYQVIRSLPRESTPLTMLSVGLLAMQKDSKSNAYYHSGSVDETAEWDAYYEDASDVVARIPVLAAFIYNLKFRGDVQTPFDPFLDAAANFIRAIGQPMENYNAARRTFITVAEAGVGNIATHATRLVASRLADPYLSTSAGVQGGGPLLIAGEPVSEMMALLNQNDAVGLGLMVGRSLGAMATALRDRVLLLGPETPAVVSTDFLQYLASRSQSIKILTVPPAAATFKDVFTVSATATSSLPVTIGASGACSGSGEGSAIITMISGTGTCSITLHQDGNTDYDPAPQVVGVVSAVKADPGVIVWPTANAIQYGEKIGTCTLSGGAAAVPGSFSFASPDTVPAAGTSSHSVIFTPSDSGNYAAVTGAVEVSAVEVGPDSAFVPAGANVAANPVSGVDLLFGAVSSPGTVTAKPTSSTAPANFKAVTGGSFQITTTAGFTGPATICLSYNDSSLINSGSAANLKLFHHNGVSWVDITTLVNTSTKKVCGVTTSFSPFLIAEPTVPSCGAPPFLTAPAASNTGSVYLSWGYSNVSGVTYVLEYSKNGGAWTPGYTGASNYATLNVSGTGSGNYAFRVRATKYGYANSANTLSATCAVSLICGAPASITAPVSNSTGSVYLSWGYSNLSGVTYVVDYSKNGGTWTAGYTGASNYATISVSGMGSGSYLFRVRATKSGYADSANTISAACAVTLACGAPASITAPVSNSTGSVYLSWGYSNLSGVTYVVEYSKNGGAWIAAYTGASNYATINVSGTGSGSYLFRVRATKSGYSASPNTLSGTCAVTLACGAPASITAPGSSSTGSVYLSWGYSNLSGVTYLVEYSKNGGAWTAGYTGSSNYATVNVSATGSGNYTFRVRATKTGYADSANVMSSSCAVTVPN